MKTRLAALASLLALVAGCADDRASIEIFGICAPPADAAVCGGTAPCDRYLASDRPFVYVTVGGLTNRLEEFIQINNQVPNNENLDVGRVNTNDFIAEEYVFNFQGVPGVSEVRHPANFTVAAGGVFSPVVPIIPEAAMLQLRAALGAVPQALVVVEMKVRGHLVGGHEIESGPFDIAVDVVNQDFPGFACPNATDVVTAVCPNNGQTASITCEAP